MKRYYTLSELITGIDAVARAGKIKEKIRKSNLSNSFFKDTIKPIKDFLDTGKIPSNASDNALLIIQKMQQNPAFKDEIKKRIKLDYNNLTMGHLILRPKDWNKLIDKASSVGNITANEQSPANSIQNEIRKRLLEQMGNAPRITGRATKGRVYKPRMSSYSSYNANIFNRVIPKTNKPKTTSTNRVYGGGGSSSSSSSNSSYSYGSYNNYGGSYNSYGSYSRNKGSEGNTNF